MLCCKRWLTSRRAMARCAIGGSTRPANEWPGVVELKDVSECRVGSRYLECSAA